MKHHVHMHEPNQLESGDGQRGAALVIVLGMVVLLTVLVVAFFSRALMEQRISHNSANQTKVDIFAQGAVDTIQSDLKQQIIVCSSTATVSGTVNLYRPIVSSGTLLARPSRNSLTEVVFSSTDLPNLTGMSSEYALYGGGTVRASSALTTGISLNNRTISMARWNKPLLLPKDDITSTDLTPQITFFPQDGSRAPHWILVARDGSNPSTWNDNLRTGNGSSEVIGRYAFMIYNEGGLLNANVAGGPAVTGTYQTIWSRKGAVPFADLTQLPGMTQAVVDQLVGWRNYANVKPDGVFPSFTISGSQIDNYFNYALGQTTRFMTISGSLNQGQSDHLFSSRQQLISFLTEGLNDDGGSKAERQNTLQYLGTFNRSLNQPTYYFERPTGGYPAILTPGMTTVNAPVVLSGSDSAVNINVQFPEVRVTGSFTRNDGTPARAGDPLVAKRFALSRILWLTYRGPSAGNMNEGDVLFNEYVRRGMPAATVKRLMQQGTAANIRKYFGLNWDASRQEWFYNPDGTGSSVTEIKRLREISGREPNFFELLKAGMRVGAVARLEGENNFVQNRNFDFQIIQIGANIIDQGQPENFPTTIVLNNCAHWGTVDLPYMYGLTTVGILKSRGLVMPKGGIPGPIGTNALIYKETGTSTAQATILDQGRVALLDVPIIWNPHQRNTAAPLPDALTPTSLRVGISGYNILDTNEARMEITPSLRISNDLNAGGNNMSALGYGGSHGFNDSRFCYMRYGSRDLGKGYVDMNVNSGPMLEFDYNLSTKGDLYREPTPLLQSGTPGGSNLRTADTDSNVQEFGSNKSYVGFRLKLDPLSAPAMNTNAANTDFASIYIGSVGNVGDYPQYVYAMNYLGMSINSNNNVPIVFTLSLEYLDQGGNWVPYRQIGMTKSSMYDSVACDFDADQDGYGSNGNPYLQSKVKAWQGNRDNYGWNVSDTKGGSAFKNAPQRHEFVLNSDPRVNWRPDLWRLGGDEGCPAGGWLDEGNPVEIKTYAWTPTLYNWLFWHSWFYGAYSVNMQISRSSNLPPGAYFRPSANNADSQGYYMDADKVVRRPMGGFAQDGTATGMPTLPVKGFTGRENNRPVMLQRPYRSVAELGYVCANFPWRQLSMITPESGYNPLLDIFCINDDERPDAIEAGRVDLNTLQAPVLQAILAGVSRDELVTSNTLTNQEAAAIADALVARTSGTAALENVADLVGRYTGGGLNYAPGGGLNLGYENPIPYDGLTVDLAKSNVYQGDQNTKIQRFMESAIRALADSGQTGVWNLMFDVIAQTGHYSPAASDLDKFMVEGERRYWVHLAIDRLTGKIIDRQIEAVNE